jgi:hypothetical protein
MDVTYLRERAALALRLARDSTDRVLQVSLEAQADEYTAMADAIENPTETPLGVDPED